MQSYRIVLKAVAVGAMSLCVSGIGAQEKQEKPDPQNNTNRPGEIRPGEKKYERSGLESPAKLGETDLRKESVRLPLNLKEGATYRFVLEGHSRPFEGKGIEGKELKGEAPGRAPGSTEKPGSPERPGATESRSAQDRPSDSPSIGKDRPGEGAFAAQRKELSLRIVKAEVDRWTVEATCASQSPGAKPGAIGAERSNKGEESGAPCTFTVSKDGKVEIASKAEPTKPDDKSSSDRAHIKAHLEHIFGYRLHEMLEPGKEYTMPGSVHALLGDSHGGATTLPAPAEAGDARTLQGEHKMRFAGVAMLNGKRVACFDILPGASYSEKERPGSAVKEEGKPDASGASPTDPTARRAQLGIAAEVGKVAYAVDDGVLERLASDGVTVSRVQQGADSTRLGN